MPPLKVEGGWEKIDLNMIHVYVLFGVFENVFVIVFQSIFYLEIH
jgi:hypothetical protein